ncbi:MAG: phosphate ABC transporter substrate-binding protein [Planctomycetota bacterium]|nr:phosphate ABC transporter substrate-binding protein [Planctomycetota bacterium]
MTKWFLIFAALLVALLVVSFGLGGRKEGALEVIGSTSIEPFAEMLAQEYEKTYPGRYVNVQGGGSTAGIQAAINGIADIGMCSRALKADETGFRDFIIARDGLAVVIHPSNPVSNLTREQIGKIFAGDIANWRGLGGEDRPIHVISREEGSGTREAFMKLVMGKARVSRKALTQESNGAVKELVRNDPGAIGYMSLGLAHGLKLVAVDGVAPSTEAALSGKYPLVRPFLFVTRGEPSERGKAFIDYVLSPPAQKLLEQEGLVPAK